MGDADILQASEDEYRSSFARRRFLAKSVRSLCKQLSVVVLEGIDIRPRHDRAPVLNLKQSFLFPGLNQKKNMENCTQTSNTKVFVSSCGSSSSSNLPQFPIRSITFTPHDDSRAATPVYKCRRPRPSSRPGGGSKIPLRAEKDNHGIEEIVDGLNDTFWEANLHALKCLISMAHLTDWNENDRHLVVINRRLIDLLKSPRSMVVRVVCQAIGDLFKASRCCRRPEFDELVTLLLGKTADANRFIQRDANIALDKMVTFIPLFHSVRALSMHGPTHKSSLVRTATARLFVCLCALAGLEATFSNSQTRKRILTNLATALMDKCVDVRRFGERLYQILRGHKFFSEYFYKDMDIGKKLQFKRIFIGLEG